MGAYLPLEVCSEKPTRTLIKLKNSPLKVGLILEGKENHANDLDPNYSV